MYLESILIRYVFVYEFVLNLIVYFDVCVNLNNLELNNKNKFLGLL